MTRVKRGVISRKKHNKIIKLSKGYIYRRKNTFKIAKQSVFKSLVYSYFDRKKNKKLLKSYWITNINYILRAYNYNYSFIIFCLKKKFLKINKKSLFKIFLNYYDFVKFLSLIIFYYLNQN